MMTAQQLKNSILQRAIEGKLVEQRSEEGSAKELLKEIKLEKEKLVKEGKIKKSKPLPAITEDEIPFDIPDSWEWVRLGDIGITITGKTPATSHSEYYNGTIPFIGPGNISVDGIISYDSEKKITDEGLTHSRKLEKGDIAQVCIGGSIGKAALITEICGFNQQINAIKPNLVSSLYLYMVLISDYFLKALKANSTGTATPIINKDGWSNLLIPLPPLSEQHRIVAKIEELLPLVDQYDKAYSQLTDLNEKFPQDMKKSILQYAIEGNLVEQRSEEGTAKELLSIIEKYDIKLTPLKEDLNYSAMDFEIPSTWEWVELNRILKFVDYRGKTPNKNNSGVFLITASNIKNGYMDYTRKEYISEQEYNTRLERGVTEEGDILFTTEAPMGNCALNELKKCSCGQRIITFKNYKKDIINLKLMMYFLLSPPFQRELLDNCTGTTAKGIKAAKLKHFKLHSAAVAGGTNRNENKGATLLCLV